MQYSPPSSDPSQKPSAFGGFQQRLRSMFTAKDEAHILSEEEIRNQEEKKLQE